MFKSFYSSLYKSESFLDATNKATFMKELNTSVVDPASLDNLNAPLSVKEISVH